MGGIGKSGTREGTSELSLENELVLAMQEMAVDTMTHQAKETACAKAGKMPVLTLVILAVIC